MSLYYLYYLKPIMNPYLAILLFIIAIAGFIAFSLTVNTILGPKGKKIIPAESSPFECGTVPVQIENSTQVPISYYQLAIIFVLFDLEAIFLFLWAMATPPMSHLLFLTFIFFMAILILIFIYVWRQGIFDVLTSPSSKGEK